MDYEFDLKCCYLSSGNIPSTFTHTIQIMKMSEAFSKILPNFSLITAHGTQQPILYQSHLIHEWYGTSAFHIEFLEVKEKYMSNGFFETLRPGEFKQKALRFIKENDFEIVITRDLTLALPLIQEKIPCIVETHILNDHTEFEILKAIQHSPYLLAIITLCNELQTQYTDAGLNPNKILVLPHGVHSNPSLSYRESNLKPKAMYAGQLYERKGIELILKTAQQLPEIDFMILGGDEDLLNIWKQCNIYLENSNVYFLGQMSPQQTRNALKTADILLIPNQSHDAQANVSCPLKLFEYIETQRPIIAAQTLYIQHHFKHNEEIFICENDPNQMTYYIKKIVNEPEIGRRLSLNAWNKVKDLSWEERAFLILKKALQEN